MVYAQTREPALENETHEILWYFEIQTDHHIPATRKDIKIIYKIKKKLKKIELTALWTLPSQRTTEEKLRKV